MAGQISDVTETADDTLVELIWKELNGRVDREQIRQAILKVKATYQDATVKTFVPIFIRREVLEMLQKENPQCLKPRY